MTLIVQSIAFTHCTIACIHSLYPSTRLLCCFHFICSGEDQARLVALWLLCAKSVDVPVRNELLANSHISRKMQTALLNLTDLNVPTQRQVSRVLPPERRIIGTPEG